MTVRRALGWGLRAASKIDRQLQAAISEVRARNEERRPPNEAAVLGYVQKWSDHRELDFVPIMSKRDLRVAVEKAGLRKNDVATWARTGGSTGEPLAIPLSRGRLRHRRASLLYYNGLAGYRLGDPYVFVRAKERPRSIALLRNEYQIVPFDLKAAGQEVHRLLSSHARFFVGYPSILAAAASYHLAEGGVNSVPLSGAVVTSEVFDPASRRMVNTAFGGPVLDRYASEEVGVVAHQRDPDGPLLIDCAGLAAEVLSHDDDTPVEEGASGRLVVTDTRNDLVPIIRYDTGDDVTLLERRGRWATVIGGVNGRTGQNVTSPAGHQITHLTLGPRIYVPLSRSRMPWRFQFAQVAPARYTVRLSGPGSERLEASILSEIVDGLEGQLGIGSEVTVEHLEEIGRLPSGKVPLYVNDVAPQRT